MLKISLKEASSALIKLLKGFTSGWKNSWHINLFFKTFSQEEVKVLFERKLHLLCSSAYNSSTCTVEYETYLQNWIWYHKFTSYGMKGANNTHILEDRTYYFYVRVNIMPEQLLEKFKWQMFPLSIQFMSIP